MDIITDFLKRELNTYDIQSVTDKLNAFYGLLEDCNKKINLTAITDKEEVIYKHFLDSLFGAKFISDTDKTILDIGAGAGFPGIVLAILFKDKSVTLIDSVRKKTDFLSLVKAELGLDNVSVINDRIENLKLRESADIIVARAVAELKILLEYSIPFLVFGGRLIAYKGKNADDEILAAKNALKILNGQIEKVEDYSFVCKNEEYNRKIVIVKKCGRTDLKYPRGQNKPRLKPL